MYTTCKWLPKEKTAFPTFILDYYVLKSKYSNFFQSRPVLYLRLFFQKQKYSRLDFANGTLMLKDWSCVQHHFIDKDHFSLNKTLAAIFGLYHECDAKVRHHTRGKVFWNTEIPRIFRREILFIKCFKNIKYNVKIRRTFYGSIFICSKNQITYWWCSHSSAPFEQQFVKSYRKNLLQWPPIMHNSGPIWGRGLRSIFYTTSHKADQICFWIKLYSCIALIFKSRYSQWEIFWTFCPVCVIEKCTEQWQGRKLRLAR